MAAIPAAPSKAWQIVPNMPRWTSAPALLLDRKNALCGVSFGGYSISANAWRVVRSSNGTTVADSDLWLTTADFVFGNAAGTTARSWTILENAYGRQLLIDYRGSTTTEPISSMSPGGLFTGGTITAKPTAIDELDHGSFTSPLFDGGSCNQHIWVSADGKQTIMLTCSLFWTDAWSMWMVGEAEDAPASWANPCVSYAALCGGVASPTGCVGRQMIGFSGNHPFSGEALPGVNGTIRMVSESVTTSTVPLMVSSSPVNIRNQVSGKWDWYELGLFQGEHASLWGPLGYWPDIHGSLPPRTGPPAFLTGDHFPGDGTRKWVKVDDVILPWISGGPAMAVG
jgi:hypothetical protein